MFIMLLFYDSYPLVNMISKPASARSYNHHIILVIIRYVKSRWSRNIVHVRICLYRSKMLFISLIPRNTGKVDRGPLFFERYFIFVPASDTILYNIVVYIIIYCRYTMPRRGRSLVNFEDDDKYE